MDSIIDTIDTIIAKAEAEDKKLLEQMLTGFIGVLFIDQDRETFSILCDLEDIPLTRDNLQRIMDQGARPVCLQVTLIQQPITFVELDKDLSVDDRVIIEECMEGCAFHLIQQRRDRAAEN